MFVEYSQLLLFFQSFVGSSNCFSYVYMHREPAHLLLPIFKHLSTCPFLKIFYFYFLFIFSTFYSFLFIGFFELYFNNFCFY